MNKVAGIAPSFNEQVHSMISHLMPAYLLDYVRVCLHNSGNAVGMAEDIVIALERAQEAVVEKYPPLVQHAALKKLEDHGQQILKASGAYDKLLRLMIAVGYMNLKIVDTKLFADVTNQGILIALEMIGEMEQSVDDQAMMRDCRVMADKMLNKAQELGYYSPVRRLIT